MIEWIKSNWNNYENSNNIDDKIIIIFFESEKNKI